MSYTKEERIFLVFHNCQSLKQIAESFSNKFPNRPVPSQSTISRLLKKFNETGSVQNLKKSRRNKPATGEELETAVLARVSLSPMDSSIRKISRECGISHTSVLKILKKNRLHPYKMKILHSLHEGDAIRRQDMANWFLDEIERDQDLVNNIMFSDECLFYLNGHVNTHNVRYWSQENPHFYAGIKELNTPRVMVWCAIWGDNVIGPYFFPGNVSAETYLKMLKEFLWPFLENVPLSRLRKLWFQQDGASAHFALVVRNWIEQHFPNRWIGRRGPVEWAARSPDMTPMDYFFWGYVKSLVYLHPAPTDLNELKERIITSVESVNAAMLTRTRRSFQTRLQLCINANGEHFEQYNL